MGRAAGGGGQEAGDNTGQAHIQRNTANIKNLIGSRLAALRYYEPEDSSGHSSQYLRKTHLRVVWPFDQSTATASTCLILQ